MHKSEAGRHPCPSPLIAAKSYQLDSLSSSSADGPTAPLTLFHCPSYSHQPLCIRLSSSLLTLPQSCCPPDTFHTAEQFHYLVSCSLPRCQKRVTQYLSLTTPTWSTLWLLPRLAFFTPLWCSSWKKLLPVHLQVQANGWLQLLPAGALSFRSFSSPGQQVLTTEASIQTAHCLGGTFPPPDSAYRDSL